MKFKSLFTITLILIVSLTTSYPAVAQSNARFTSGKNALKIPFKLYNNNIYLQVRVNDRPMNLILDTGAPHILDTRQAQALGLQLKPAGRGSGSGEATVDVSTADGVTFDFPGANLSDQRVGVLSFEGIEECANKIIADPDGKLIPLASAVVGAKRQALDGIVGHGFFMKFVVELDYNRELMNLYEPKNFKYSGGGEIIPIEIQGNHIFLRAQLTPAGGVPLNVRLLIDTGMATALALNSPFIEANKLTPQTTPAISIPVCGIGGYSPTLMSTAGDLLLGKLKIVNPVTLFSQAKSGSLAETDYDGILGNALLRNYRVIFDYSRSRMILETPK